MGYVKFTETVGEISKTYEFGSYEDFKDWENKRGRTVVNPEIGVISNHVRYVEEPWIPNIGSKPDVSIDTYVEVMFRDKTVAVGTVGEFYWGLHPLCPEDCDIVHYRKAGK